MKIVLILLFSLTLLFGEQSSPEVCPIDKVQKKDFDYYSNQKVEVTLPEKFSLGKNNIKIMLTEEEYPSGYNVVAFVDIEESSSKKEPEVENDIPISSIEFYEKGNYELLLQVNIIYRSS